MEQTADEGAGEVLGPQTRAAVSGSCLRRAYLTQNRRNAERKPESTRGVGGGCDKEEEGEFATGETDTDGGRERGGDV